MNIGNLGGVLTAVFITLKLCKVIAWSWVWVLAPAWITLLWACTLSLLIVGGLISIVTKTR